MLATSNVMVSRQVDPQKTRVDVVEEIILGIADVDQDVEEEKRLADAATAKLSAAQDKLIHQQLHTIQQLNSSLVSVGERKDQIVLTHSQIISGKDALIQSLMERIATQEKLIESTLLQVEQEKANNVSYRQLLAEKERQRAHQEYLNQLRADGF